MPHFLLGVGGAFVAYFALYREARFREFYSAPKKHWNTFVFDLVFFLLAGGLVAAFLIGPENNKEAFMAGISWQGIVGGVLAGNELKIAKTARRLRRSKP